VIRLVVLLTLLAGPACAACRQALVLGLDISGSVDDTEYRQQLDGLAGALAAPAVRAALLAMPGASVDVAVFEWSGPLNQRILLPWQPLDDDIVILRAAATLADETVQNFVPWRISLRHWEAVFEHDCELTFDCVPFAH